ncbi:hypothetical protein MPTK1_2g18080 [Marchantia polymorpha subsp. ruderalis]|uniref:Acyl-[acyl-carrier-protein] hydrolase n=1 Tax=Marchantia polymorpha TaxID=3197 RepID=A0A2R6WGC9_MARPO|nr:hypothetical protein MARPO_0094s0076 [Marchantia polymorpha]BBN02782.1 hypothetical protein Mp_2g18080 [Marchantia polymorpha subsp. ruderalis]|eukprot:PTQ32909.1 hypothetical protein MARPO_0094s0076 [Marchantia polymorpha]
MASLGLMSVCASASAGRFHRSSSNSALVLCKLPVPSSIERDQCRIPTFAAGETTTANLRQLSSKLNALSVRESQHGGNTNNKPVDICRDKTVGEEDFGLSRDGSVSNLNLGADDQVTASCGNSLSYDKKEDIRIRRQLETLAALRQGRILGDSQIFRQTCVIRSYEVNAEGRTSVDTILSLFQEVALNHVSLLGISGTGFGATKGMNENRLIWVITRLHVEVDRYPAWPEAVEIDSWVAKSGKNGMRRDWLLREYSTGHVIARATSTWALMHEDTRRLAKLPDVVRDEITPVFIERCALHEGVFDRISKLDDTADYIKLNLTSCRNDLDVNKHINNVKYMRWVMESVPPSTSETHELSTVTLEYRRECQLEDIVESLTNSTAVVGNMHPYQENRVQSCHHIDGTAIPSGSNKTSQIIPNSSDREQQQQQGSELQSSTLQYTHLLRKQSNSDEIVRGRTVWTAKSKKSKNLEHDRTHS